MSQTDFDVVVIGTGAAGLSAALMAAEMGARTIAVESETRTGGSSRLSGGVIQAAGTSMQQALGIEDRPEAMLRDYLLMTRWRVPPHIARVYCDHASETIDWLIGLGVTFGPLERAGAEATLRGHRIVGEGEALITRLENACRTAGVEFAFGNRVDGLLIDGGRVSGVAARGEEIRSTAVVMASGGFARNAALQERYLLHTRADGTPTPTPAGIGSRGDALTIGTQVGAGVTGQQRALWTSAILVPNHVLLVQPDGSRFINESEDSITIDIASKEFGGEYYAVFAEQSRAAPPPPPVGKTASGALFGVDKVDWSGPPVAEWLSTGDLVVSDTIAEIARHFGMNEGTLEWTVDSYNLACSARIDSTFMKNPEFLEPISAPPFFGVRIRPQVLVATFCGLRVDELARVHDVHGRVMPGFFAAGEAAGGILGDVYVGHGNSLTTSMVFGRIAGRGAAELTSRHSVSGSE